MLSGIRNFQIDLFFFLMKICFDKHLFFFEKFECSLKTKKRFTNVRSDQVLTVKASQPTVIFIKNNEIVLKNTA